MEIFVSAGEASSDIHCAKLLSQLKKQINFESFGLGGDNLAAAGTRLLAHSSEFSVAGGPLEVAAKLPKRRRLEKTLERYLYENAKKQKIKGAILVDNGEINLRLASLLHFFGVPVVYFIPPKVWVWRHSRIEKIAQHVKLVLGILPFEEMIYKNWEIPFQYVGNPLLDEIDMATRSMTSEQAREKLGINPNKPVLTVMAGSRHTEIQMHCEIFSEAIKRFLEKLPSSDEKPLVLLPAAQAVDPQTLQVSFGPKLEAMGCEVKVVKGESHLCLKAARAALVKSGTSTLEAALLQTPMVLAYHSSRSAEWIYKHVVRYRGFVGMVNLFLEKDSEAALGWKDQPDPVVPELILENCTPDKIAEELLKIYQNTDARNKMLQSLSRTVELLKPPKTNEESPIHFAAQEVLRVFS